MFYGFEKAVRKMGNRPVCSDGGGVDGGIFRHPRTFGGEPVGTRRNVSGIRHGGDLFDDVRADGNAGVSNRQHRVIPCHMVRTARAGRICGNHLFYRRAVQRVLHGCALRQLG